MSVQETIAQAFVSKPAGAVFSSADFLSVGSRTAIDQALARLVRAGTVVRLARGLYAVAGQTVDAQALARAVASKTGERVGLASFSGVDEHLVIATSGQSRTLRAAGHTVEFRRMSQRKVQLAASIRGRVLLGLWNKGVGNLTTLDIQRATSDWSKEEIDSYAAMIPAWLREAIREANASRKSLDIGLSGAYDWSNPSLKDDVLIGKVLKRHKFDDVARICFHFGTTRVRRVLKRQAFESMTQDSLTRMLGNISRGMRSPAGATNA